MKFKKKKVAKPRSLADALSIALDFASQELSHTINVHPKNVEDSKSIKEALENAGYHCVPQSESSGWLDVYCNIEDEQHYSHMTVFTVWH